MEGACAGLGCRRWPPGAQCGRRPGGFPLCGSAWILSQGHTASSYSTINVCVCPRVWENPRQKGTPRQRGPCPPESRPLRRRQTFRKRVGEPSRFRRPGQLADLILRSVSSDQVGQSHVLCRADKLDEYESFGEKREPCLFLSRD